MQYTYTLIIPHYNNTRLLRRLLKTVPLREDLQVIIVDDCSTKELEEIKSIKQEFPKLEWYDTGTNGGGGKARNVGLKYAQGKYVLFADADDYFEDNFNELLDDFANKDYDIIYFSAIFENEISGYRQNNNYINDFITQADKSKSERDLKFLFTQPWGKLINRKLITLNKISFEESNISNDVYFSTITDYYAQKVIAASKQCYVWVIREESTSRKLDKQKILKRLEIDLIRHNFLKSIDWKDKLNYLEMINEIDSVNDKILKRTAISLCQNFGISKREILGVRLKRIIRSILKFS